MVMRAVTMHNFSKSEIPVDVAILREEAILYASFKGDTFISVPTVSEIWDALKALHIGGSAVSICNEGRETQRLGEGLEGVLVEIPDVEEQEGEGEGEKEEEAGT
jgi:hypothetical protein